MRINLAPRFLAVLCLSGLLACSDQEETTAPTNPAIEWTLESTVDTLAFSPFVTVDILITTTPADTSYLHVTVESLDFDPVDFTQMTIPADPGQESSSVRITGRIPIWTDWLMTVDAWSQHSEVMTETVFWNGILEEEPVASQAKASLQVSRGSF